MIEARRIVGLKVTKSDLEKVCETPLSSLRELVGKVAKRCEAKQVLLFGGALRNYIWKSLHKPIPQHKVDADIMVVTDVSFSAIITTLGKMKEFSPLLVVSDDTIRASLGNGKYVDLKFVPTVKYATIDFTINAVFAHFDDIFEKGSDVYCASLDDLEEMVLRHITPFEAYPFHIVRGIRLASTYNLKIVTPTLKEYRRKVKNVLNVSPPLIHRELAESVNMGYERAVWFTATTNLALELFPMLKSYAKKNPDTYTNLVSLAYNTIAAFNPQNKIKEVLQIVPQKLLKRQFAPGGRNILYCYFIASFLLPFKTQDILRRLHELNFYPAERGVISMCVASAQQNIPLEKAPPLVVPFLVALQHAKG